MCGIAGIYHAGACPDASERVGRMAESLRHRGPDGAGAWSCADVALGHRRLSILDLEGGRQPMANEDGAVQVVYNGEIYNHRELRRELVALGHRFASDHADTEVLVHGYEAWGEDLPRRLNGMFAFALWDAGRRCLFVARDRYGIKPLYWASAGSAPFVFASEVRGLFASGLVAPRPHPRALLEYLSLQNVWGEETPFEGVRQFPAGCWARIGAAGIERRTYWDFAFPRSFRGTAQEAAERHREILTRVLARQMDADVPVTTYLSGGIDSSGVAAAAARNGRIARAYTCLFDLRGVGADAEVDEREAARATARHLGLDHVELELPADELTRSLDVTIDALEYPRMGMSYVNYRIAERVGRDARVVLSGTGGDEIHGGYVSRYRAVAPAAGPWEWLRRKARACKRGVGLGPEGEFRCLLQAPLSERELGHALTPEFLSRAGESVAGEAIRERLQACPSRDPWDRLCYLDAKAYLHGLLVLEDKLSMAHSLETRVPLLDNELVDFGLDLPWSMLCDERTGKIVFRESVRPWVPESVYRKPKMGFGPPDASWYRGALRGWLHEQLAPERIGKRGIFRLAYVARVLEEHDSGRRNHVALLWTMLSVEAWCRRWGFFGG